MLPRIKQFHVLFLKSKISLIQRWVEKPHIQNTSMWKSKKRVHRSGYVGSPTVLLVLKINDLLSGCFKEEESRCNLDFTFLFIKPFFSLNCILNPLHRFFLNPMGDRRYGRDGNKASKMQTKNVILKQIAKVDSNLTMCCTVW